MSDFRSLTQMTYHAPSNEKVMDDHSALVKRSFDLPGYLLDALKKAAKDERRSTSNMLRVILERSLARGVRIYLSGPMTGRPGINVTAFGNAAAKIRLAGHDGVQSGGARSKHLQLEYREYMRIDCEWICAQAEAVVMLPGWRTSPGAKAEHALATAIGLDIFFWPRDAMNAGGTMNSHAARSSLMQREDWGRPPGRPPLLDKGNDRMNKARILELADIVEASETFNMAEISTFGHPCRTPGCIAGHALYEWRGGRGDEFIDAARLLGINEQAPATRALFVPRFRTMAGTIISSSIAKMPRATSPASTPPGACATLQKPARSIGWRRRDFLQGLNGSDSPPQDPGRLTDEQFARRAHRTHAFWRSVYGPRPTNLRACSSGRRAYPENAPFPARTMADRADRCYHEGA